MKKRIISNLVFILILATIVIMACNKSDNPVNTGGATYSISGTINFVDTNIVKDTASGSYTVDAFALWPPQGSPNGFAFINITKSGNIFTANYTIPGLSNGTYVITSAFLRKPYTANSVVGLGLYGCDTSHSLTCIGAPTSKASVQGYNVTGINFLSWIDTNKRVY